MLPTMPSPLPCSGSSDSRRATPQARRRRLESSAACPHARIAAVIALGAAVGAFAAGAAHPADAGDTAGTTITGEADSRPETLETAATQLLNELRSQPRDCGAVSFDAAPPLRWDSALAAAAAAHSLWMQATDSTRHEQDDGSTVADRAEDAGYRWEAIGENLAAGPTRLADAVTGWLDSPPHCENLMNPEFEEFAIARVSGTPRNRFATWWTLVLARPRP